MADFLVVAYWAAVQPAATPVERAVVPQVEDSPEELPAAALLAVALRRVAAQFLHCHGRSSSRSLQNKVQAKERVIRPGLAVQPQRASV